MNAQGQPPDRSHDTAHTPWSDAAGSRCLPPSFAQQRLWFLDQLVPGNPFYNEHAAVRIGFPVNAAALERSLGEIVRRHETLRTTFMAVDGEPVQVIAPVAAASLPLVDLRRLPREVRQAEAVRIAAEEARRPFDLRHGPLFRTTLLQLDEAEYVFLLTTHHIISDGWSLGVFGRELETLYPAMAMDRPSPLPPLPIQYLRLRRLAKGVPEWTAARRATRLLATAIDGSAGAADANGSTTPRGPDIPRRRVRD